MALSLQTLLKVQSNISAIFKCFYIRSCVGKMKTQETFKKKTGHKPVLCVTNYFLVSTLLKPVEYVLQ